MPFKKQLRHCFKCKKIVQLNKPLIKLKDNRWYCFSCILSNPKTLFSLLKIDGYWHSLLKRFIYPKYKRKELK